MNRYSRCSNGIEKWKVVRIFTGKSNQFNRGLTLYIYTSYTFLFIAYRTVLLIVKKGRNKEEEKNTPLLVTLQICYHIVRSLCIKFDHSEADWQV